MNFSAIFSEHYVAVVTLGCLVLGYCIKNLSICKKIPNNDIPAILAVVGAILYVANSGLSIDSIVYGAFTGLTATGMYEMFRHFVENFYNKSE